MNKNSLLTKFFGTTLMVLIFAAGINFAQDNPNQDRVPKDNYNNAPFLFSPFSVVTINDYDNYNLGVDFAEVHISVNPLDPKNFLCAYNVTSSSMGVHAYMTVNGYDWTSMSPTWGASMVGDPVTGFDKLGYAYIEQLYGSPTGTKMAKSTNTGASWTILSDNTGNDKNWFAIDLSNGPYANNIYTTITPGNVKRSTDGGTTFSTVFSSTNTYPGMTVAVGPNVIGGDVPGGCVYVVTNTGSTAYSVVYNFFCSTDGGSTFSMKSSQSFAGYVGTWSGSRHSVSNMRTRPYPFIACDNSNGPNRGRLYLVYATNDPAGSGNKPDVFLRYSTDQGSSWSSPIKVNDDANSTSNHQWLPYVYCDNNNGNLYFQWLDTRDVPTSDSCYVYATMSTDGGATFAPNQRISNAKFKINCTTCGGGGTPAYEGDYNGMASNGKVSMLAWSDFRNGNFGSYVAYYPDFGMRINPAADSLVTTNDTTSIFMVVPSVKSYTDTVIVSAEITPTPASGTFTITYPSGNKLTSYPGYVRIKVATGSTPVTLGTYTLNVTAAGPNGTPIHKRTSIINVVNITGVNNNSEIVNGYELQQNYPNPFNPVTKIIYNLAKASSVKMTIYNTLGQVITHYDIANQTAGKHEFIFNAGKLASGLYYYKLETPYFTDIKKMVLTK
ncbi:MAG TPA: T9SS type A sorting domain-containing protein [Ignavibacteria bacterium]|nr:T9SS type A sorting domain-containing protein [Ignavibacteria bacterium]